MDIVITILILGAIIFIHELGHFISAKWFKMPVAEFSIGMGPKLFGWKRGETEYNLRGIPLGGYVNILGMEPDDKTPHGFYTKKPYQRFIVLFAGVFMNFILGWITALVIVVSFGDTMVSNEPVVGFVEPTMPAFAIIKEGDRIKKIDNEVVKTWEELYNKLSAKKEAQVILEIERKNVIITTTSSMKYNVEEKKYKIGIAAQVINTKNIITIVEIIPKTNEKFVDYFTMTFLGFKNLGEKISTGTLKGQDISGPIGMVKVVPFFKKYGLKGLVFLTGILSVGVGVFNLLPFPALDGGRIIFVIMEMFGIKVSKRIEEGMHRAGLVFLLILMALIAINDIINIPNKLQF